MEIWASATNLIASIVFIRAIAREFIPKEVFDLLHEFIRKFLLFLSSYMSILVEEYDSTGVNDVYESVETYLGSRSSSSEAKRLKLGRPKNAKEFTFTMAENEKIVDTYDDIKVRWRFRCKQLQTQTASGSRDSYEKRYYEIKFNKKDQNRVLDSYFPHILAEANAVNLKCRPRKIYSNRNRWWTPIVFEHPATFETLALDPHLKQEIMTDLRKFSDAKDYYKKVGRAWKRGYLLYGPPGTGKSTMIAAIANFLEYDIYDLELTQVKTNVELRNLLVATTNRSVIVIEDIDCSLDLSDRKKKKKKKQKEKEDSKTKNEEESDGDVDQDSRVTLSGVLNFTDGLWSCCGNQRLIVFTTNHIDRLDAALLRAGRMDKHIHLSYCRFPAFKVLALNYLGIEEHPLFEGIECLIEEVEITPADVCEVLMTNSENPTCALQNLMELLLKCKAGQNSAVLGTQVPRTSVEEANLNTQESRCEAT